MLQWLQFAAASSLLSSPLLRPAPTPRLPAVCCQDDGSCDRTSSPVRALVAGLTRLVGGDVSNDAVLSAPKPGTVTPQALLDGVRADYVDRLYLWTGDIDPDLYDDDCVFTDPTLSFRGLATFQKNLEALQPFLKALVREPAIDLYSCKLDEPNARVQAVWRMRGDLALPWRPAIDLKGRTTFTFDPSRGGRITDYEEEWQLDAGKALLQLVTPKRDQTGAQQGAEGLDEPAETSR